MGQEWKLLHAFSPAMLPNLAEGEDVHFESVSIDTVKERFIREGFYSFIGKRGLARVLSTELRMPVTFDPGRLTIPRGKKVIIAQYEGPRLEDDTEDMPPSGRLVFIEVTVLQPAESISPANQIDIIEMPETTNIALDKQKVE